MKLGYGVGVTSRRVGIHYPDIIGRGLHAEASDRVNKLATIDFLCRNRWAPSRVLRSSSLLACETRRRVTCTMHR